MQRIRSSSRKYRPFPLLFPRPLSCLPFRRRVHVAQLTQKGRGWPNQLRLEEFCERLERISAELNLPGHVWQRLPWQKKRESRPPACLNEYWPYFFSGNFRQEPTQEFSGDERHITSKE